MARNLYAEVTDRILAQLRQGVVPWKKPWSGKGAGGMPRNAVTGRAYSGSNVVLLWITADERGYSSPLWLTYKQCQEAGGQVRKGEKSTTISYMSIMVKQEEESDKAKRIGFLKAYNVFNVAQCDGLPAKVTGEQPLPETTFARSELAEEFIQATGARITHGEARAYFRPSEDRINIPLFETFSSADSYYATTFHELTHWTAIESRCDRNFKNRFGDQGYSAEELVAELGSAFLCAEFGFDSNGQDAAYIAHWIQFLENHEKAFVSAASQASKAIEFMRGLALADEPMQEAA